MNPNSETRLTIAESLQLAEFLAARGHKQEAWEVVSSVVTTVVVHHMREAS